MQTLEIIVNMLIGQEHVLATQNNILEIIKTDQDIICKLTDKIIDQSTQ